MKKPLLSLLALSIVVVALLWRIEPLGEEPPEIGPAQLAPPARPLEPTAELERHESKDVAGDAAAERESIAVESGEEDEEPESAEDSAPARRLAGEVILVDQNDVETTGLDGSISFVHWTGTSGTVHEIPVEEGRFEVELASTELTHLTVSDVTLEGRGVLPIEPTHEYALDTDTLRVRCRRPPPSRLEVVDQRTGAHLGGVTLVRNQDWAHQHEEHPGRVPHEKVVLRGGTSPIELEPTTFEARAAATHYQVHVDGYAWKAVQLDFRSGGERRVGLVPSGGLSLEVIGQPPPANGWLRLRPLGVEDSLPYLELGVRQAGTIEIEALAPGTYAAVVEAGKWYASPPRYGEVQVEVVAGETSHYRMELRAPEAIESARLAGTVVVPRAWAFQEFELRLERRKSLPNGSDGDRSLQSSSMTAVEGEVDTWAFDFGSIASGSYGLEVRAGDRNERFGYGMAIELTPPGLDSVRLEVPPPTEVRVRLIEASSDEVAEIGNVHWSATAGGEGFASTLTTVMRAPDTHDFRFRAPVGPVQLGSFGSGYATIRETLQVEPGLNEFEFRVDRDCPLVIQLRDGEASVPFSGSWWPKPEHLDGEGTCLYTSSGTVGFKLGLSEPGRYLFDIPEQPDFEPIPQQEISVVRGEETVHVVHLVRK